MRPDGLCNEKVPKRVTEKVKGGCCPFSIAHRVLKYVGLLQGGEGEGGGGIESRDGACMVSDVGALYPVLRGQCTARSPSSITTTRA